MRFIERIIGMITKPDATTKDIVSNPRIEEGLLLVGIYMVLGIILTYATVTRVNYVGTIQGLDASAMATISTISGIVVVIVMVLIGWPVVTGACHVLSMFFGGEGKFHPTMLALIGYTNIPLIVFAIVAIVATLMLPVTTIDLGNVAQATKTSTQGPIPILINYVIPILGGIWTAFMTIYAVKNGEKLSMNNALVVVGVLFVINLLYIFSSFILASLM